MNDNRLGGIALIIGITSGIVTMIFHPITRAGQMTPAEFERFAMVNITAHGLAIAGLPLLFLGALALTRRLDSPGRLALAALVIYTLGLIGVTIAPALSGLVATDILRQTMRQPDAGWNVFLRYNFMLNQAFSAIFVVASCAAIALWSLTILRTRSLASGLGIYGLVIAPVTAGALLAGLLHLDVHGFGLVIFTQAIWFITAGVLLFRANMAH